MKLPSPVWPVYFLYGIYLATDFPFQSNLKPIQFPLNAQPGRIDLSFSCSSQAPADWQDEKATLLYASPTDHQRQSSETILYRLDQRYKLSFRRTTDFYISPDQIVCTTKQGVVNELIEIDFLGVVLAFWLELQQAPVFHGAVVAPGEGAIGFLGNNHTGKSSLAAEFLATGSALLADDMMVVKQDGEDFWVEPSYPSMRLWQNEIQYLLTPGMSLHPVHPLLNKYYLPIGCGSYGKFCHTRQPLKVIYLLNRQPDGMPIDIKPVAPQQGLVALLKYTFTPRLATAAGLAQTRLRALAQIAQKIPVRQVFYTSGIENLTVVRRAILDDCLNNLAQH